MLTFETIMKATKQLAVYGEGRTSALDLESSKLTGGSARDRHHDCDDNGSDQKPSRVWNAEKGIYTRPAIK